MNENTEIAICHCLIDNYDEIIEINDYATANLNLMYVEQYLTVFAKEINGMIQKIEKDKFLIIMHKKHVEDVITRKYNVIESIKNIDKKIPITLSVGISYEDETVNLINEGARSALDLALGRGGDQVVIKKDSDYEFYGEAGIELTNHSKVKARVKSNVFSDLISNHSHVFIMGHSHPDLDCFASAIGAYRIVKSINPGSVCKIVMNNFSSSVSKLYEKLMEIDEYKDNIFIDNQEALSTIKKDTLLIVVDVFRNEGTECPELLEKSQVIVVFDHHRKSIDFIKNPIMVYHDAGASSTAELISDMIIYSKESIKLLKIEADALLSGMTVDTKGFVFKTSFKTFEVAAFLKKNGASSHNVHKLLQSDLELYKIKSEAVNNAIFYKDIIAMASINCSIDNPILAVAQTADELLNLTNIKASFVFFQINDKIYVSARSLGEINVQLIMEKLGGGGHRTIAAAQVENSTIDNIMAIIKTQIDVIINK